MATNYPTSADDGTTLPDPTAVNKTNSPSHSSLHANTNGAVKALEAKLGTGATTPAANRVLFGTGSGTSAWQQLTSAQLAAVLSDETGTGVAVFATSPTLVTPAVNTINESTPANGVTIDGLNIKDGALNTNNSVVTANITNASVTANKLATGAASATVATSETTTSTSYAQLATTTDTVTVTVGANGLALVSVAATCSNSGADGTTSISFAISGASTVAASTAKHTASMRLATATAAIRYGHTVLIDGLTPGSTTFGMRYLVPAGTGTFLNRTISVVPL
jgi:hypothetical protein